MNEKITINAGVRWEPFFSQNLLRGAITRFDRDLLPPERSQHAVQERARRPDLSRRSRLPRRCDRTEYQVDELRPTRRDRLGRPRRRSTRNPILVRALVRLPDRRVHVESGRGAALRQPRPAHRSARRVRQSVRPPAGRRSASDRHWSEHRIPAVGHVCVDRSRSERAAHPVVERHGRTAARHQLAGIGELPGPLLRSAVGLPGGELRRLHGAWPVHDQWRGISRSARPTATCSSGACCRPRTRTRGPPD